ncbi:NAD(P)-dependent dehydrogenase (short-subunit alcohol dehydrogenase family) [Pseudomonas nitritireducens]|uniref:NAD(P)-dependent dehydrogenase (Short-subunit alcohol dehydrogenase family) n=1 Tax=Pseudomonas nitroreducens TaxID=46680 RepID=A0A7W7KM63_PSENT|nr:SDR family oxidoreductase [Pseudomonas nitritireducens]MBB4864915.1 NAD(P)-dependent dehydrogenase (short-subunit alcohol dehydrogenase family) [Pseudomonas nitritireducens]
MIEGKTLVIIGGTSGIGLRAARLALQRGARVVLGARDEARLASVVESLGPRAEGYPVDNTDRRSLGEFFARLERIDGLFTPAASYQVADFNEQDEEKVRSAFERKFWPQYWAVQAALPVLAPDAGIVLVGGAAGARPVPGAASYAACNSAIEGLARALAVDLAPRRVNVIAPGTLDGELWQSRDAHLRESAFAHYAQATLLKRVGTVEDAADAALFLLGNPYMSGATLSPDGGYTLR